MRALAMSLLCKLCFGCSARPHNPDLVHIEYSVKNGYGNLGHKLLILGTGKVDYEGYGSVGVLGFQDDVVPKGNVAAMVNVLHDAGFFSLPERVLMRFGRTDEVWGEGQFRRRREKLLQKVKRL